MSEYNERDARGDSDGQNPSRDNPYRIDEGQSPLDSSPPSREQNTYWSSQDARRAQQGGGYSQSGNHSHDPGYRSPRSQQRPYQYSTNGGWQNTRQNDRYEWNFDDYDKLSGEKKKKKNRGLVVFAVSLLCVLAVSLVGLSSFTIYNSLTAEGPAPSNSESQGRSESGVVGGDRSETSQDEVRGGESSDSSASEMQIVGRPEITETIPVGGKLTIPEVAEAVLPSVVGVVTYENTRFFEEAGSGSGIIMSEDGYIITNAHVVAGADAIKVVLHDDEPYEATLIGTDTRTDLAVIKIDVEGLAPAVFGDSDELRVGETVIAIGNPAGTMLAGSVTQGIVSAVNREVQTSSYSMNYIQTDAAINPGNSGGALVNEYGQVIGINSSKIVASGYEGIGFAIPISEAKPIIDDLLVYGRVTGRVVLGITASVVDEVTAVTYNVPMGLQIQEVQEGADIANKGVQTYDILTHIDNERIYNFDDVAKILETHKAGDTVKLTLWRQARITQGTSYDVNIVLHEE